MGRMEECYIHLHEVHSFLTKIFFFSNKKSGCIPAKLSSDAFFPGMILLQLEFFLITITFFFSLWTVQSLFSESSIILALLLGYYKQCELVVLRLVWNLSWIMLKLELKYIRFLIISLIPDLFLLWSLLMFMAFYVLRGYNFSITWFTPSLLGQ